MKFLILLLIALQASIPSVIAQSAFLDPYPNDWQGPGDSPPPGEMRSTPRPRSMSSDRIRMAYLIPSNRTPQATGVQSFQTAMTRTRDWYRDQMFSHGHASRSPNLETDASGAPLIHVVNVSETDDYLRGDIWSRTVSAASNAGLSIWSQGEIWILIPEIHLQTSDGKVEGGVALGASFGSGSDGGVAMFGSDGLVRYAHLADDRPYAGLTLTGLGPYPLVQDVSFPWFEGTTLSSTASAALGALMHELGHALGLPHDFRNDENFRGNLMGNGLRGIRGNFFPANYPGDQTWLSFASAQALSTSRYLRGSDTENEKPTVTITTSGSVAPSSGLLDVNFTASDASGLALAHLSLNGSRIAEMSLEGTVFSGSFSVPWYEPNSLGTFLVAVYDIHGNKREQQSLITPSGGSNRAPRAQFRPSSTIGFPSDLVVLDAAPTTDPDGALPRTYEWDLDGDGVFDTDPMPNSVHLLTLDFPGRRHISVRVTDQAGASSVSAPLVVDTHVTAINIEVTPGGIADLTWQSRLGIHYQPRATSDLGLGFPVVLPDLIGNGGVIGFTEPLSPDGKRFFQTSADHLLAP